MQGRDRERKVLDSWSYSIDDGMTFRALPIEKLGNLPDLIPGKEGYINLHTEFTVPAALRYKTISLAMGRIMQAAVLKVNNVPMGQVGLFPPRAFSSGTSGNFFKMPPQMINVDEKNTIDIILYVCGSGGISTVPVICAAEEGFDIVQKYTFVNSTLNLILAAFLLFASFGFLLLFSQHTKDREYLFFALMNIFTILYMFPYFYSEFTWLVGFMDFFMFEKIFVGVFGFVLALLAGSFSYEFTKIKTTRAVFIVRMVLFGLCTAGCFLLPNQVVFYETIGFHVVLVGVILCLPLVDLLAQWKKKKKRILSLVLCYSPMITGGLLDIITKALLKLGMLPYFIIYGWVGSVIIFMIVLSRRYANVRNRVEYLNSKLDTEVKNRTEELTAVNRTLAQQSKQAERDMALAVQVQQALNVYNPVFEGWDVSVYFKALEGVSGDSYDFYSNGTKLNGIGLYDVSGRGISTGLVSMLVRTSLGQSFEKTSKMDLCDAVQFMNDSIIRVKGNIENYLTGNIFRISGENSSHLEMVNVGNPSPVFRKAGKSKATFIMAENSADEQGMLGVAGLDISIRKEELDVDQGDVLVLYTDGFSEAKNMHGEIFGKERMLKSITLNGGTSKEILEQLMADFSKFTGNIPLEDDVTVLVLKKV